MTLDRLDKNNETEDNRDELSQEIEDEDLRHLLDLDKKRNIVLFIVSVATAVVELGLLTVINLRKTDPDSRNKGSFYYVFFRYFYMLIYVLFYIPASYVIEMQGLNKSLTLGMFFCTVSMWAMYGNEYTIAMSVISFAFPFIMSTFTLVSAKWFGPKGRNIATGILLLSRFIPVGVEVVIGTGFE